MLFELLPPRCPAFITNAEDFFSALRAEDFFSALRAEDRSLYPLALALLRRSKVKTNGHKSSMFFSALRFVCNKGKG
jgi:hypothetical protein